MEKTAVDFEKAVKEQGIRTWPVRKCSICDCPLYFNFHDDGSVSFDSNCNCVTYTAPLRPSSFDIVADVYNSQICPEVLGRMNKFWGFENV